MSATEQGAYLVWSFEHEGWCDGQRGYTRRLTEARRFTRIGAMRICHAAVTAAARRLGMLPDLPVRWDDVEEIARIYSGRRHSECRGDEPWI
jgi:hypothetical protein